MGIAFRNGHLINTCNMKEYKREERRANGKKGEQCWNGKKGEQFYRTSKTSNGTSHGPDCEAKQGGHATQVLGLLALLGTKYKH